MLGMLSIGYVNNYLDPKYDKDPIEKLKTIVTLKNHMNTKAILKWMYGTGQMQSRTKSVSQKMDENGEMQKITKTKVEKARKLFNKEYIGFFIFIFFVIYCGIIPTFNSKFLHTKNKNN